mmetsp:Transcript_27923/g.80059  ORF Transcript_27923/g.80059 Transcript_27923/m.80059 type:complete len:245 (-) Transcript_27923:162-896(-)
MELGRRQHRGLPAGEHVRHLVARHLVAVLHHLLLAQWRLHEGDVCTGRCERAAPRQGLLEAHDAPGIRARHDEDVVRPLVPGVASGADPSNRLVEGHDRLPLRVTATLWGDLVLDHDAGQATTRVATHGSLDVHRVAVTGVAVSDAQRASERAADAKGGVEHLLEADELAVGITVHGADTEAGHERELEAIALDQASGQPIVHARRHQRRRTSAVQQPPQSGRGRLAGRACNITMSRISRGGRR